MSKKTVKHAFLLAALILLIIGSYLLLERLKIGLQADLTKEQREVDTYLRSYYLAYGNRSTSTLLTLFDEDAILSAPDGTICRGADEIRSYFDRAFMSYSSFTITRIIVKIEVRGADASAVYETRVRPRTLSGDREPPQLFYRDTFVLRMVDSTWRIKALLTEVSQAKHLF
ncbi:nuclear transport factor 2 family protein [Candidatus Bathyarchaeota archaeon]|nr:nuclear transport factor 2 family protein [Candidatus Bathyarchaeota archaeon]